MQDTSDQDPFRQADIENNMFAVFESAQTSVKGIASTAKNGVIGQELEAVPKTLSVTFGLRKPPRFHRIADDGLEVRFSHSRYAVRRQSSSCDAPWAASSST